MKRFCMLATLGVVLAVVAAAVPISGLKNTGTTAPGTSEANWKLFGGVPNVTDDQGNTAFPFQFDGNQVWGANTSTSRWITPQALYTPTIQGDLPDNAGYDYTLAFDLTGYNPATASFSFRYMADDQLMFVRLNNTVVYTGANYGATPLVSEFGAFINGGTINSAFKNGVNELWFGVYNGTGKAGNPAALRVEFTGSNVDALNGAVPEPSTFALVGLALIGLPLLRRRR